jgi:hypothetical protein
MPGPSQSESYSQGVRIYTTTVNRTVAAASNRERGQTDLGLNKHALRALESELRQSVQLQAALAWAAHQQYPCEGFHGRFHLHNALKSVDVEADGVEVVCRQSGERTVASKEVFSPATDSVSYCLQVSNSRTALSCWG